MTSYPTDDVMSPYHGTADGLLRSFRHAVRLDELGDNWQDFEQAPIEWMTSLYPDSRELGFGAPYIRMTVENMQDLSAPHNAAFLEKVNEFDNTITPWMSLPVVTRDFIFGEAHLHQFTTPALYIAKKNLRNDLTNSKVVLSALRALQFRHLIRDARFPFNQKNYDALTNFVRSFWGPIHPKDRDLSLDLHRVVPDDFV